MRNIYITLVGNSEGKRSRRREQVVYENIISKRNEKK
jgi:hypothetical protein